MSGMACDRCGRQTVDAKMPICDRADCPFPPLKGFKPMKHSPEDIPRMRAMLREKIAQKDAERGRPLTDKEKLENLRRAIYEDDAFDAEDDNCPTCQGTGTVNPLTAPKGFFCAGTADCPHCDGTGRAP